MICVTSTLSQYEAVSKYETNVDNTQSSDFEKEEITIPSVIANMMLSNNVM
jgi:hypothetical protein